MFDQLLDTNPPDGDPAARTAVRGRVRAIARRRRAVQAGGVAGVLVIGGVAAVLATGGSDGTGRVTAANGTDRTSTPPSTTAATPTTAAVPTTPAVSEPPTTGSEIPAGPTPTAVTTVPAPTVADVHGHLDCYGGQVSKYVLELAGGGATRAVPVGADGNYSAAGLVPGTYTATVTCESVPGTTAPDGTDIGGASTSTRETRDLTAGANVWNISL